MCSAPAGRIAFWCERLKSLADFACTLQPLLGYLRLCVAYRQPNPEFCHRMRARAPGCDAQRAPVMSGIKKPGAAVETMSTPCAASSCIAGNFEVKISALGFPYNQRITLEEDTIAQA
ncbi:MAG: hypothetical protein CXZ00_01325 [Acidobacteria bacterium]|nr:MAG: hypothetical protein CXZ00_01325 [Acidobacteriota bacterium]